MRAAQDSYKKLIGQNFSAGAIGTLEKVIVTRDIRNFEEIGEEGEMLSEGT
jgi:hypothetical protein